MGKPQEDSGKGSSTVSASDFKPNSKGSKGQPVIRYDRLRDEPRIHCPNGHEVVLSRIPWQAGCRLCSEHNGWSAEVLAQYYSKVLSMEPLPWHSATSANALKVAQFKGKGMWLKAQEAEKKGKGNQRTPPPEPPTPRGGAQLPEPPVLLPIPPVRPVLFTQDEQDKWEQWSQRSAESIGLLTGAQDPVNIQFLLNEAQGFKKKWELHIAGHQEKLKSLEEEIKLRKERSSEIKDDIEALQVSVSQVSEWEDVLSSAIKDLSAEKVKERKAQQLAEYLETMGVGGSGEADEMMRKALELVQKKQSSAKGSGGQASPPPPPPPHKPQDA